MSLLTATIVHLPGWSTNHDVVATTRVSTSTSDNKQTSSPPLYAPIFGAIGAALLLSLLVLVLATGFLVVLKRKRSKAREIQEYR